MTTNNQPDSTAAAPDASEATSAREADRRVLELLVCPLTKTTLEYQAATNELISRAANLAFPICNGIPMMVEDAARPLTEAELEKKPR